MSKKWSSLWLVAAGLLVLAACAPAAGYSAKGVVVSVAGTMPSDYMQSGAVQTSGSGTAAGGVESGAGAPSAPGADGAGAVTDSGQTQSVAGGVLYTNATYKFSVTIPSDFVVRPRVAQQLAQWNPKAVAGILFMNPTSASSQVPDEPGDLEVRVYDLAGAASLDGWLNAAGLPAGTSTNNDGNTGTNTMYWVSKASGVKVCRSTMIAPQCTYFFIGNNWVYQLISMTQAGDSMLASFTIAP